MYPHVRLYELSKEDGLSLLASFLEQLSSIPATRAIVLVNAEESYDLDTGDVTVNDRDSPVPIVVMKRKAGESLVKLVKRHDREVEVAIEGESVCEGGSEVGKEKGKSKKSRGEKGVYTCTLYMYVHNMKCVHLHIHVYITSLHMYLHVQCTCV